jgi:hypothetical protein
VLQRAAARLAQACDVGGERQEVGELLERLAPPEGERLIEQRQRPLRRWRLTSGGGQRLEARRVQVVVGGTEPVAVRLALQRRVAHARRPQEGPQAVHLDLERARRVLRRLVPPQQVDQAVGRDHPARLRQKGGQQQALLPTRRRHAPSGGLHADRSQHTIAHGAWIPGESVTARLLS